MEGRTDFVTKVVAVCVAGYVAVMLHCVARADLGFSDGQIRRGALAAALVVVLVMAVGHLGAKRHEAD